MLEIRGLSAGYGDHDVIEDINLCAHEGEILAITGPNGCGKTTLLKSIARLLPCRGTITLGGKDLSRCPRKILARSVALMGQHEGLYFPYSVYDTVSFGRFAYATGVFKRVSREDDRIICRVIAQLGLEDVRERMITELSGGQLQRVFLARTLVQDPDLILLDEPTNHLDLKHQVELLDYLSRWARENRKTAVAVLHDLNLALRFGGAAALMARGRLIAAGPPDAVLAGPRLAEVYGMDIRAFMLDSLARWRNF